MDKKQKKFLAAGGRMHQALEIEKPLQIVGVINAYVAMMAEQVGYRALYLSGAGVANYAHGLPDLGMTSLNDVLEEVYKITSVTSLPLLVDIDTGWGNAFNIARTVKQMIKAGAAAVHIEDQVQAKRCGHRPNKSIVSPAEMVDRIKAAVDARTDSQFIIMARTDALATEDMKSVIERVQAYVEAGAGMIFFEAVTQIEQYAQLMQAIQVPVLANMTEFGVTPLFTREALAQTGVHMILHPLSAARAMNAAALQVYRTIRETGSAETVLPLMQTREELYKFLHYEDYEKKLDALFAN